MDTSTGLNSGGVILYTVAYLDDYNSTIVTGLTNYPYKVFIYPDCGQETISVDAASKTTDQTYTITQGVKNIEIS